MIPTLVTVVMDKNVAQGLTSRTGVDISGNQTAGLPNEMQVLLMMEIKMAWSRDHVLNLLFVEDFPEFRMKAKMGMRMMEEQAV